MGEGITIKSAIDSSAFKNGIREMRSACNSLVRSVRSSFQSISGVVGNIAKRGFGLFKKNAAESMMNAERSAANLMRTFTRMLPAMIGIRGAFGMLQRGASSFLSANKQLSNQLNACWTAIGNVIGPIIEMLVNLLTSLISYLITFLHLIGLSSKSASQAAKKTGAAAGAMQKSLMGFDEINKLQDGGGGGGSGSLYDPEMPEMLKKLGEALKLLMEDLKKTWKEAWDENGRGEKMMQSLKTLLTDIIDLATELVLAFDRAWMNGDNGKQIFADILEIITNIAGAIDPIVNEAKKWVKSTGWLNVIVKDVRLIFDELNEISRVIKNDISPILAQHVQPLLNTIALGFHTVLEDVKNIAKGIKEGLESTAGRAMVDSLATLVEKFIKFDFSVADLTLGTISKIDWTTIAGSVRTASDSVGTMFEKLSTLFGNDEVQETIARLIELGTTTISGGIQLVSTAIGTIADYLNGANWEGLNTFLENITGNIKLGIDSLVPVFSGQPITKTDLDNALTEIIGTAIGWFFGKELFGVKGGVLGATLGSSLTLNMIGLDAKDGGGRVENLLDFIKEWLPRALGVAGLVVNGLTGGMLGLTIGTLLKLAMENVKTEDGGIKFDTNNFLKDVIELLNGKNGALVGAVAGTQMFHSLGGALIGATLGATISMALQGAIEVTENGISFDQNKFVEGILGKMGIPIIVAGALGGAKLGATIGGLPGAAIGLVMGAGLSMALKDAIKFEKGQGFSFDKDAFIEKIMGILSGAMIGGVIGSLIAPGAGTVIGIVIGAGLVIAIEGITAKNGKRGIRESAARLVEQIPEALIEELGGSDKVIDAYEYVFENIGEDAANKFADGLFNGETTAEIVAQYAEAGSISANAFSEAYARGLDRFSEQLDKGGFSAEEQAEALAKYEEIYLSSGVNAANAFAEGLLRDKSIERAAERAAQEAQKQFEKNEEAFQRIIEKSMGVAPETQERLISNHKAIFDALGLNGADAYRQGIINRSIDIGTTAQEFIDSWGAEFDAADKSSIERSGEKTVEDLTAAAKAAMKNDTEMSAGVAQLLSDANIATETDAQTFGESLVAGFIVGILNKVKDLKDAVATLIGEGIAAGDQTFNDWTGTKLQEHISNLTQIYTNFLNQFKSDVQSGIEEVESRVRGLHSSVMSIFSSMAGSAGRWGADMMHNLASGIYSSVSLVANACRYVASVIDSYLGFSEPDVGPLSKFHTFMPDMMQLMAEGIYQNANLPERAIDRVAQSIADSAKIDPGLVGTMNNIANNVAFQTPAFAEGTMIPYGIGTEDKNSNEDQMVRFMEMMQQSMFQAFNAALSNQNKEPHVFDVYLDGKQIADSVTKWQRRDDRAGGK